MFFQFHEYENRYKLITRDDDDWNGTAWSYSFDTKEGQVTSYRIPWENFKPTQFARVISKPPFDKKYFTGIQLSLSKFEYDGKAKQYKYHKNNSTTIITILPQILQVA